jgi:hypothetical protein
MNLAPGSLFELAPGLKALKKDRVVGQQDIIEVAGKAAVRDVFFWPQPNLCRRRQSLHIHRPRNRTPFVERSDLHARNENGTVAAVRLRTRMQDQGHIQLARRLARCRVACGAEEVVADARKGYALRQHDFRRTRSGERVRCENRTRRRVSGEVETRPHRLVTGAQLPSGQVVIEVRVGHEIDWCAGYRRTTNANQHKRDERATNEHQYAFLQRADTDNAISCPPTSISRCERRQQGAKEEGGKKETDEDLRAIRSHL